MDIAGMVAKAAERSGFVRERFDVRKIPTDAANITVLPFFGDLRSLFVLSSLLLRRFRDEDRGSKYFVLASWPGFQSLFPYVDEYWGVSDEQSARRMYAEASLFRNKSNLVAGYYRTLNQYFFEDVVPPDQFAAYYDRGIQNAFWEKYRHVKRSLPAVQSAATLSKEFNKDLASRGGFKLFVYPATHLVSWHQGDVEQLSVGKKFWISLCSRLLSEGYVPVVYKGLFTHDISADLTEKCVFCNERDFGKVLTTMRATGCVLDLFTGISRLALAARCPFLVADERAKYSALREYEMDDLCCPTLPKQYIFSFPTIIEGGGPDTWDFNIINNVVARLDSFLPGLDRDAWPPTGESTEIVPYEAVRKKKLRKIGTKLLKVPKD